MTDEFRLDEISGIVFDLDGTLVDAFEEIAHAVNHALEKQGMARRSREEIIRHVGYGSRFLIKQVFGDLPVSQLDQAENTFKEYYAAHVGESVTPIPGARELLETLRRKGYLLGVFSNKPHDLSVKTLQKLGMYDSFEYVMGVTGQFKPKPAPEGYRFICAQLELLPEEVLMIGDGETDIESAREADARAWGVTTGIRTREQLEQAGAERVFRDLHEVRKVFERVTA